MAWSNLNFENTFKYLRNDFKTHIDFSCLPESKFFSTTIIEPKKLSFKNNELNLDLSFNNQHSNEPDLGSENFERPENAFLALMLQENIKTIHKFKIESQNENCSFPDFMKYVDALGKNFSSKRNM